MITHLAFATDSHGAACFATDSGTETLDDGAAIFAGA
jgi:hypothetical protein